MCIRDSFYYIALKAGVPIVPSVLDYAKRIGTVLPPFTPTGDIDADMQKLAAIYAEAGPKHPALHGPVRVRPQLDDERQAAVG